MVCGRLQMFLVAFRELHRGSKARPSRGASRVYGLSIVTMRVEAPPALSSGRRNS